MIEELLQKGERIHFQKGFEPIVADQHQIEMYYILKGLVRGYYITADGNEVTKCFSAENQIFGVEGFLYNRNATYFVECLEDVECIKISYEVIRNWMASDVENAVFANKLLVEQSLQIEERTKNLLLDDASQRYQKFLSDYKSIENRLKQKYIASYLGINAVSLSRLRNKKS